MLSFFRRSLRKYRPSARLQTARLQLEALDDRLVPSVTPVFVQSNLVSDIPGMAANTDSKLINPWGISLASGGPFWVSDEGTGYSTLYNGQGQPQSLQVVVPTAPGSAAPLGTPTGTVFNTLGSGFDVSETVGGTTKTGSSIFLFDTLDGTISGWSPSVDSNNAIVAVNSPGSVFTGLAIGTDAEGQTLLYAVDHHSGVIKVYNDEFQGITNLAGSFTDPKLPTGAVPFNIQNIGGKLYVEYTVTGDGKVEGAVDVFTTDGKPVNTSHPLIVGGQLDSPWGVTMAPATFGQFGSDLLVGNFGNGMINAFNPATGAFIGTLTLSTGQPFEEDHLWALTFGSSSASSPNTLYFTAGINDEKDGLLGSLQAVATANPTASIVKNIAKATEQTVSTSPANGDGNPYGAVFVPQGFQGTGGVLQPGDLLVSNFNDSGGVQGTGTTIVTITPEGQQSVFFQGQTGLGLTTALSVLKSGYVIVGNVPTNASGVAQQGSLLILNSKGQVVTALSDSALLNGPWDMAVNDQGANPQLFISNVLSGTVTRINLLIPKSGNPVIESETMIASGYAINTNQSALVVGPTGLAFYAPTDTLFVASTDDNAIYAIPNAAIVQGSGGLGRLVTKSSTFLHGPIGLVIAPDGNLIVSNGDAINANPNQLNEIIEITQTGQLVAQFQLDNGAAGAAFGIAVSDVNGVMRFAAVDDNTNSVDIWTLNAI
jgi:uncharacterized protein (TIGR03118 family)